MQKHAQRNMQTTTNTRKPKAKQMHQKCFGLCLCSFFLHFMCVLFAIVFHVFCVSLGTRTKKSPKKERNITCKNIAHKTHKHRKQTRKKRWCEKFGCACAFLCVLFAFVLRLFIFYYYMFFFFNCCVVFCLFFFCVLLHILCFFCICKLFDQLPVPCLLHALFFCISWSSFLSVVLHLFICIFVKWILEIQS